MNTERVKKQIKTIKYCNRTKYHKRRTNAKVSCKKTKLKKSFIY